MKLKLSMTAAAAVIGASLLAMPAPASAAQFSGFSSGLPLQAQSFDNSLVHKVQRRGRPGRRGPRRGGRRGGGNAGAAAAGAIMGLAIGAMIAGQAAQHNRDVEWCMRRYRSYDPRTGTWVDYHGRIRHCP